MPVSGLIDGLLIGVIISLTLGLCFFTGFSGHESTGKRIDLPVHNSRTTHHQAETQVSWWLRLKHYIFPSRPVDTSTDFTGVLNFYNPAQYGTIASPQEYYMSGGVPFAPSTHILDPTPYIEAQLAEEVWRTEKEHANEYGFKELSRADLEEIAAKAQHNELLHWNKIKKQQEQIAIRAARIIAGPPVDDLVEPETSKETPLAHGDCEAPAADEKDSDTPSHRPKRPRAPSFDDKEHERERDIYLVRNKRAEHIVLSAPPRKKYKKAKHQRARRAVWWFTT